MLSQLYFALVLFPTVILASTDFFGVFKTIEDIENNCIQYDSADNTICIICKNDYFLDDLGNCILIPDCLNPLIINQDNIICEGNILLIYSEEEFFDCPQNCFICVAQDRQGLCQTCSPGYLLSSDQSECFAPIDNCSQMEIVDNILQCASCNQGYEKYIDNDGNISCLSCSTFINNCNVCAYENYLIKCSSCQKGYFLDQTKRICTPCSDPLCVHCSLENVVYFNPITGLTGKETRESCLQCPKNYGFHYDGKSCQKCSNGCQSCFWSLNGQISYTAIWNFKAYSQDEIAAESLNFQLICNLTKQTCFDFNRSKIYFRKFSHRLTPKCTDKHSAIFNSDYDLNHEIFGCGICSTQKSIFGRVELSSMTCLACNPNMQMYFPQNQLTQKQACSEICSKNCLNCHADLITFKLSCLACNQSGQLTPLYKNAIKQLNEVLNISDRLPLPDTNPLFLLDRNLGYSSCLNCLIGCVKCMQDIQNDSRSAISKINFQQLISKLDLDLQQLSKNNLFCQPPNEIIEMMNSRCLQCQEGYQMSYPLMKCIKCEDDKLCRYFLEPIVYDLSSLSLDSTFADDYLELLFSEWNNLETFVKINQLNIQQIDITFLLGEGRFSFRERYSLNLAFMKAGYVLANSSVTFKGRGMDNTILALTKDFSILFFNKVSFESLHIDISSSSAFENFELLSFSSIRFSPTSSQNQFGDIHIFSNLAGITVADCEFGGVHSATSTFFKILDVSNYLSFNFQAPTQTTIQIISNTFLSSWQQSQCFLDTSGFLSKGLDLTIDGNTFEGSFCSCFVWASSMDDLDALDYRLRTLKFHNNVLNITLYTGSYFFRDSTADYVSLYNNTLLSISVFGMDDSSSTLFSFFQGEINNTFIGQVNASRYELYLFDVTGTQTTLDIDYCIDPEISFNTMSTLYSNSFIRVFSQPLIILNESRNNKKKRLSLTNLTLFDMEFRNNSAAFNFEPVLNIALENITFYDMTLHSNFLKACAYNFIATSIKFNRFGDSQIIFSITAFNTQISSISFIDSANTAFISSNILNQLMDLTISKKYAFTQQPAYNITYQTCFSDASCELIPDKCLKQAELSNSQNNYTYSLNVPSNQLEETLNLLNNEEEDNQNENPIETNQIEDITIDFEEASYYTGTNSVSQVLISDIQIQNAFISGMLFQISNDKRDLVAKIVFQNARIDQIIFLDGGIGSLFSPLFVQSSLPMSFFILQNITVTNTFAVLYNSASEDSSKIASSSLFSIESHYFYGLNIKVSNDIPSSFFFPYINDEIAIQDESVRFLEYVGQYFWLVSSSFSNIASLSGGVVKASSDSPVQFKLIDIACSDISVSKNGGILYFFTSSAADMYLWIESSSFEGISAEVNGGFIDINNLYNQISLHIVNCLLTDIFSNSSAIIQVKDNTNGAITFHDVQIEETKGLTFNKKMIMMDMSKVNLTIVNFIVKNVRGYHSLIRADHSDIFMYNVTIVDSEYYLGLMLFSSCQVQINSMLMEGIVQVYQNIISLPSDQPGNPIRTNLNSCRPLLQFLFCDPVIILNTSFQSNELDTCSGSIISLEQSISQIFNLTVKNTQFRQDSANFWQHSLINYAIEKDDLIHEYPQFLSDSSFTSNSMGKLSNGCVMAYNSKLVVINTIFANNTAENGAGIFFEYNDQLENLNRILRSSKKIREQEAILSSQLQMLDEQQRTSESYLKIRSIQTPRARNRVLQDSDGEDDGDNSNLYGSFPWNENATYFDQFSYDSLWVDQVSFSTLAQSYSAVVESQANNYLIVDGCTFAGNSAVYEGGAILIQNDLTEQTSNTLISIFNSNFIGNSAGINSPGISSLLTIPTLRNNTDFNNTVNGQLRTAFNIAPSSLSLLFPNGTIVDTIRNITSGQLYGEKCILSIAFLNLFAEKVYLNDSSLKQNQIKPLVYLSYPGVKIAIDSFNASTGLITIPAQQYISMPGSSIDFVFTSPNIFVPEIDENGIVLSAQNDYQDSISAEFRPCVVGEVCLKSKKLCILCQQGYYSLEDPSETHCKACPIGASCPGGNVVLLTYGYWSDQQRDKDEVVYCLRNPSNCIGDDIPANSERLLSESIYFPCKEGHRGALCEVCDTRGLIGTKRFQQTDGYECEECNDLGLTYVKIGIVLCACTLFALLTVYTLISEIQNKILKNSLKILGFLTLGSNSQYFQIASSLFKILINYQQINLIVYTLDLQVPSQIFIVMASIISPFKFLQTGVDCILTSIFSEEIVFVKVIGFCLLPLGFFALLILALAIIEILKKKVIKSYYFYASCFFITLFSVPSVVQYLALVLSCRSVGTQKFITADMSLLCYSSKHMFYLESVILPGLVIYAFLCPLLLICLLNSNKKKFEQRMFEMRFGFLYRDFKPYVFYWEIVRLMFKVIIYVAIGVLDEQLEVKALLVSLLLIIYYVILHRVLPFQTKELNRMESLSVSFNIMTMLMALLAKQIDTTYSNYFLYVFVLGQNIIFLCLVFQKFYYAYRKPILRFFKRLKQYILSKFLCQEEKSSETQDNKLNPSKEKALKRWRIIRMFLQVFQQCQSRFKDISLYSPLVIVVFSKARSDGKESSSAEEFKSYLEMQLSLISEEKRDNDQESSQSVAVSDVNNQDKIQNDMQNYILNHDKMFARKDNEKGQMILKEISKDIIVQEDNNQSRQIIKYNGSQATTNINLSNINSSTDNIHRLDNNTQSITAERNRLHNSAFQDSNKELLSSSAPDQQLIHFLPSNHNSASRQLFLQEQFTFSSTDEHVNNRSSFSKAFPKYAKSKVAKLEQRGLQLQDPENP